MKIVNWQIKTSGFYRSQSGQSMIYIIGFVPILVLALLYVFNANMAVNEKTRLQNTVDAVALTAATFSAREYNFKAYANRAMVANQVSIAQAVGLQSWLRYIDKLTRNSARFLRPVPIVGQILTGLENVSRTVTAILEPLNRSLVDSSDFLITALSASQEAFSAASLALAGRAANTVAQLNNPNVDELSLLSEVNVSSAVFVANQLKANGFTSSFQPRRVPTTDFHRFSHNRDGRITGDAALNGVKLNEHFNRSEEFRNITNASLDRFSTERNNDIFTGMALGTVWLEKRGGTSLLGNDRAALARYGSWVAMDTLSFHSRVPNPTNISEILNNEILPLGWGAARSGARSLINRNGLRSYANQDTNYLGGKLDENRAAGYMAADAHEYERQRLVQITPSVGLTDFYDLTVNGLVSRGPKLRLVLGKRNGNIDTSSRIGMGTGSTNIEESVAANSRVYAMSAAAAVFSRINEDDTGNYGDYIRADGLREYGSLYNPYWQAKVENMTAGDKSVMQGIIAGESLVDDIRGLAE